MTIDAGLEAQRVAEAHLAACQAALYAEEESGAEQVESPAGSPFCGCDTCEVREVLAAAWPVLLRDAARLAGEVSEAARAVLEQEAERLRLSL